MTSWPISKRLGYLSTRLPKTSDAWTFQVRRILCRD